MFYCRSFVVRAALSLLMLVGIVAPGRAQDIPPGTPPDIAAIIRRLQKGGKPTASDIAKLQAWAKQVQDKANAPALAVKKGKPTGTLEGIPCQIRISVAFSGRDTAGKGGLNCSLSLNAMATLVARIDGTGDYYASMMNPDVHASSFQFAVPMKYGQPVKSGSGTYSYSETSAQGSSRISGRYEMTAAGFTLATTGRPDELFGLGGAGGAIKGTITSTDQDGTRTAAWTNSNSTETHDVTIPFAMEAVGPPPKVGTQTPRPTLKISYKKLVAAIKAGGTQTLTGGESFNFTKNGMQYNGSTTLAITLNPKAVRLIIEPVDMAVYKKWVPMPDAEECNESKFFGNPDPLQVHVVLQDGSKPAAPKKGTMTSPNVTTGGRLLVSLSEVSSVPGLCMNYPRDLAAKEGLFFPRSQPAGIHWIDDKHVETDTATAKEAIVKVAARDTAAYGQIQAECGGLGIIAEYPTKNTSFLPLPLDDNDNHIADQWERDKSIYDRHLPPDWDEEDEPAGWKSKGDGLSLFEEYRGFLVETGENEEFKRLTPGAKRKLFVFPVGPDASLYKDGTNRFSDAFGIDTYFVHNAVRLKPYSERPYDLWMNFNKTPYTLIQQCAIRIQDTSATTSSPGATYTIYPDSDTPGQAKAQCPQTVTWVNVSRRASKDLIVGWQQDLPPLLPLDKVPESFKEAAKNTGRDLTQVGNNIEKNRATLINELIVMVVMHELGHSIGGRHHDLQRYINTKAPGATKEERDKNDRILQDECYSSGDHACIMRYWHADVDHAETVMFLDGTWDLTKPLAGGKWIFCAAEDTPNLHIKP
jgi:hypothetical protein